MLWPIWGEDHAPGSAFPLKAELSNEIIQSIPAKINTSAQIGATRGAENRDCFLKTAVPCFGIDLSDSAFFYNQSEYRELKELAETEQGLSPPPQVL